MPGRHDSSDPPGETAAEADTSAVTDPHEVQPAVTVDSVPLMLAESPRNDRETAALLHPPEHVISKLPVKSASLKRSASLPSGLATLPAVAAVAAGISIPEDSVAPGRPSPDSSLAHSHGELGSFGKVQGHITKGHVGRADPISSLGVSKGELHPAFSLPLVHAAVLVAPSLPSAASPAAATAAADSVLHNPLRNGATSNVSRSAFKPYNGNSLSLSCQGAAMVGNTNSQNRLAHISGNPAGRYDHMGVNSQGSNCKGPIADDKENFLPAETHINRPTQYVSKGPASMTDTGTIKVSSAVSNSAVGGLSSADGHGPAGGACEGNHRGKHETSVGVYHTHLGHCGAESAEPGENSASKRAKLTHDVD